MLEEIFGNVENQELVQKALTHPSFTKENNIDSLMNYERLEFLGDSVLKLVSSKLLYNMFKEYPEGELSKIRSILISDNILAKVSKEIGVDKLIKLGPAEEKQGGRSRESNLACSLEALLGAYFLNNKFEEIEDFIKKYLFIYVDDINEHFENTGTGMAMKNFELGGRTNVPTFELDY